MRTSGRIAGCFFMSLVAVTFCRAQEEIANRPDVQLPVSAFTSPTIGSGARAMGMGGAFIAVADDASAALWNPAGVAQLETLEMSLSWQARNSYNRDIPGSVEMGPDMSVKVSPFTLSHEGSGIDFISALYPFRWRSLHIVPQVSYRRAIDAGLDRESTPAFFENTEGARSQFTFTGEDEGGYDVLALTLAVGNGTFFGGASVNLWTNGYEGVQTREEFWFWEPGGSARFTETLAYSADASGTNATLGFLVKPKDRLSLGLVFRTPFTLKSEVSETVMGSWEEHFVDVDASEEWEDEANGTAEVDWPWSVGTGVAVRPTNHFKLAFDYTFSKWSDADFVEHVEDSERAFMRPYPIRFTGKQKNSDQFRTGFEYLFVAHNVLVPLRAGAFVERQFFMDDYQNRVIYKGVSLGGGVGYKRFMFDIAGVCQFSEFAVGGAMGKEDLSSFRLLLTGVVRR